MGYKEKDKVRIKPHEFIIKKCVVDDDHRRYYDPDGFWMYIDDDQYCGKEFEILKVISLRRGGILYILSGMEGRLFSEFFLDKQQNKKFEFVDFTIEI